MINKINRTKIIFKQNSRKILKRILNNQKSLIVCTTNGKKRIQNDTQLKFLKTIDLIWISNVKSNPSIINLEQIKKKIKNKKFNNIIAIGGGSVIDTAKAIKLITLHNEKNIKNLFKNNLPEKKSKIKLIALPTTSGTGSEVTCFSTIWDTKNKKKLSLNYETLYPNVAIVDPELTLSLPLDETINTGLDAFNQAFESTIWTKNKTKNIEFYGQQSIKYIFNSLPKLIDNKHNKVHRNRMSKASLYAGLCISANRTSLCHSMSYPLTANLNMPHGLACAVTMIPLIKYIKLKNKNFFNKLIKKLKLNSYNNFERNFENFFKKLNLKSRSKKYIKNRNIFLKLSKEMYTPGRADNFPYKVNILLIKNIINSTYEWLYREENIKN